MVEKPPQLYYNQFIPSTDKDVLQLQFYETILKVGEKFQLPGKLYSYDVITNGNIKPNEIYIVGGRKVVKR